MSFRSIRERKRLSQEKVAELSGLSLRTVQRLEAGHRVSYASLRALAAAFEMDVDLLERELYAVKTSTEDFVEIPGWVRVLSGEGWWKRRPLPGRRHMLKAEAFIVGLAAAYFLVSCLVTPEPMVKLLRYGGLGMLLVAYLQSVLIRITDTYGLWPPDGGAQFRKQFFARKAFGIGKREA
jgi:transcriptional regulator with XRE-family HTH domain